MGGAPGPRRAGGLHRDYRESRPGLHADLPHERHLVRPFHPCALGSVIAGVRLAEGGRITAVGQHEAGLYEGGGAVYPAGGGPDWVLLTLMLAAVVFWIALLGRTLARRRRRLAEPPPEHLRV